MITSDIRVGDRVRWNSSAGWVRGEIKDFYMAKDSLGRPQPRMIISIFENNRENTMSLCAHSEYLSMMKFRVTFRDQITEQERGAA